MLSYPSRYVKQNARGLYFLEMLESNTLILGVVLL